MDPTEGSMEHYHYYRQMGAYGSILWRYLEKTRGINKNTG